jgi:hypothetical protein
VIDPRIWGYVAMGYLFCAIWRLVTGCLGGTAFCVSCTDSWIAKGIFILQGAIALPVLLAFGVLVFMVRARS